MPKQPKDPHAPKKPYSSYLLFSIENRSQLKLKHPDVKPAELTKLIGVEWQALSDAAKQVYKDRAEAEKTQYAVALSEYKQTDNFCAHQQKIKQWKEDQKDAQSQETAISGNTPIGNLPTSPNGKKTNAKQPKDANRPKMPQTSYFLFAASVRKQILTEQPNLSTTEISKVIGPKWKALTAEERQPWTDKAKQLKEAYNRELEAYQQTAQYQEHQQKVKEWKLMSDPMMPKVKLPRKPKDTKCPKKSATTYFLFAKEVRAEVTQQNPGKSTTEIAKLIGARWKDVSEEKKALLTKQAAELKREYELAMERYRGSEDEKAYKLLVAEWESECNRKRMKAVEAMQKAKVKQATAMKEKAMRKKHKKSSHKKSSKYVERVESDSESSSDGSSSYDSESSSYSSSVSTSSGTYSTSESSR